MRAAAASARALPAAYTVVIVTTDERVAPEAEAHLAPIYSVYLLQTWQELVSFLEKQPADVILLDVDTCAEQSEQGVAALAELRSASPDLVLIAMTRSVSRKLRHQAIDAAVDDYFVAPVDFEEMRVVVGRLLEKRAAEVEYRRHQEEAAKQQSCAELIGGSEPMLMVYEAIKRISQSSTTVLIRGESGCGK
jgi:DNA-binding NtrC family response regulator